MRIRIESRERAETIDERLNHLGPGRRLKRRGVPSSKETGWARTVRLRPNQDTLTLKPGHPRILADREGVN